jgi:antitoxin VapB
VTKEYRAKVFKSGNSLALRLPKALGLEEGSEMVLREAQKGFIVEPSEPPKRKIDVSKFAGKVPGLKELPRYEFDDPSRDWAALDRLGGRN